jgi:hypothetical protein
MLFGAVLLIAGVGGCGARTVTTAVTAGQSYPLIVTGTSTNLAGVVVTHSANVKLVLQ